LSDGSLPSCFKIQGDNDFVEVTVKELENENLKINLINAPNNQRYRKKGIPEAIIKELSNIFGKTICSSTNFDKYKTCKKEYRNENANKYWQRLVSSGHAIYDNERDIYYYQP
jgi:hypothetical protein